MTVSNTLLLKLFVQRKQHLTRLHTFLETVISSRKEDEITKYYYTDSQPEVRGNEEGVTKPLAKSQEHWSIPDLFRLGSWFIIFSQEQSVQTSSSAIMSDKFAELSASSHPLAPLTLGVIYLAIYLPT